MSSLPDERVSRAERRQVEGQHERVACAPPGAALDDQAVRAPEADFARVYPHLAMRRRVGQIEDIQHGGGFSGMHVEVRGLE